MHRYSLSHVLSYTRMTNSSNGSSPSIDKPNSITHGHQFSPTLPIHIFVTRASPTVIDTHHSPLSLSSLFTLLYCRRTVLPFCRLIGQHLFPWRLGSSSLERDHRDSARAISITNPGSTGASTGITNAVRRNETVDDRTYPLIAPTPSGHLSTTTTTNGKRDEEDLMQHQQTLPQSKVSLAESQFYARTSMTPNTKRTDVLNGKSDGTHSSTPIDDTFHDATDDLNMSKDQTVPSKGKPPASQTSIATDGLENAYTAVLSVSDYRPCVYRVSERAAVASFSFADRTDFCTCRLFFLIYSFQRGRWNSIQSVSIYPSANRK